MDFFCWLNVTITQKAVVQQVTVYTRAVQDKSLYIFSLLIWESGTDNYFNCHNFKKHEHEVQKPGSLYNPHQL